MSEHNSSDYRVFIRDSRGFIERIIDLKCDGDADGRAKTISLAGATFVELWQGSRLVCRFDADGKELPKYE